MMRECEKKEPVRIQFFEEPSLSIIWESPQHRTFEGRKGYSVLDLESANKRPRRFARGFLRLTRGSLRRTRGSLRRTGEFLCLTRGFLRLTRGSLRLTRGRPRLTRGFLRRTIKILPEKRRTHNRLNGAHPTSSVRNQIMIRYENI